MLVVGLTGSIGMGKSAAAAHLRKRGISVFDADAEVHRLYVGAATDPIANAFPGTVARGKVDRQKLSAALLSDPAGFKRLEAIIHPLVRASERAFLCERRRAGDTMAVLEIPLLFETGAERCMDAVIVVSASGEVQRRRVLERPGMTEAKLAGMMARQMPDAEKRRRADFVVDTNGTLAETEAQIDNILAALRSRPGTAFERHWQ
jgi:dephospho-CoA kinase